MLQPDVIAAAGPNPENDSFAGGADTPLMGYTRPGIVSNETDRFLVTDTKDTQLVKPAGNPNSPAFKQQPTAKLHKQQPLFDAQFSPSSALEGAAVRKPLTRPRSSGDIPSYGTRAGDLFEPGGWMGEGPPPPPRHGTHHTAASANITRARSMQAAGTGAVRSGARPVSESSAAKSSVPSNRPAPAGFSGAGGSGWSSRPDWLNAAQKVKLTAESNSGGRVEGVLPRDQNNTFGLRVVSGGLTEAQLRGLEKGGAGVPMHAPTSGHGGSQGSYGRGHISAGGRVKSPTRGPLSSGSGMRSAFSSPTTAGAGDFATQVKPQRLTAQEEAFSSQQQYHLLHQVPNSASAIPAAEGNAYPKNSDAWTSAASVNTLPGHKQAVRRSPSGSQYTTGSPAGRGLAGELSGEKFSGAENWNRSATSRMSYPTGNELPASVAGYNVGKNSSKQHLTSRGPARADGESGLHRDPSALHTTGSQGIDMSGGLGSMDGLRSGYPRVPTGNELNLASSGSPDRRIAGYQTSPINNRASSFNARTPSDSFSQTRKRHQATTPPNGGDGSRGAAGGSGGGGGKPPRKPQGIEDAVLGKKGRKAGSVTDREERNMKTRDFNALHAIPWEQRGQMPMTGFGTRFFSLLATPRFWEKMDWTFRGSLLTVVPTMILSLDPTTKALIPVPSMFAFMAFWVTMPTFGSGLRETVLTLKGVVLSGVLLVILIWGIRPEPAWLSLILLFLFTVFYSFVGDVFKKNTAYLFTSTLMEYINSPSKGLSYLWASYITTVVSLCFGVFAFLVPFIRWSSEHARHYTESWGNALSISVQGTCSSFWVDRPIERELNLGHLRQLRATAKACAKKVGVALEETEYEPHTGSYVAKMTTRYEFCQRIHNILFSMQHLIELLTDNPHLIDTPTCNSFGTLIHDDLTIIASAMDSMILKIVDFKRLVSPAEIAYFREARDNFQDAVSSVREDVILNNENYEAEISDVYLGYFLFCVDELCEVICSFEEATPRNNLKYNLMFFARDAKSVWKHTKHLYFSIVHEWSLTRRIKEAIKLGLCMSLPGIFQIYALDNDSASPLAGASVIALLYHATGAESFHYASNRLLGTVFGSLLSLVAVELAGGKLWLLYIFIIIFSFAGAYVQAAPGFYALGNAVVCSVISIMTQYDDNTAAMERIKQNCFAILVYFAISSMLWPMRAHTKVKLGLDTSLRCIRETCTILLRNLDMPYDVAEVDADASALLKELSKKIATQTKFIPGAIEEPTLGSVEFPEEQWWAIVEAERNLCSTLSMMRSAYRIFMSKRADTETTISVHWVVLHRIAPSAADLADLIHAMVDLHLLLIKRTTIVPISHLTRLRLAMQEAHRAIIDKYILTLQRKVDGEDDEEDEEDEFEGAEDENDWSYSLYNISSGEHAKHNLFRSTPVSESAHMDVAASFPQVLPPTGVPPQEGEFNNTLQSRDLHNSTVEGHSALDLRTAPVAAMPPAPIPSDAHHDEGSETKSQQEAPVGVGEGEQGGKAKVGPRRRKMGASAPDDTNNAAEGGGKGAEKKKRGGYLTYKLTSEEEKALRAFLVSRRAGAEDSLGGLSAMPTLPNMSFTPNTPKIMMSDARLLSSHAEDESLAGKLRKKHKIKVEIRKEGDGTGEDGGDDKSRPRGREGSKGRTGQPKSSESSSTESSSEDEDDDDGKERAGAISISNASFLQNKTFFSRFLKNGNIQYKEDDGEEEQGGEHLGSTEGSVTDGKTRHGAAKGASGHVTGTDEDEAEEPNDKGSAKEGKDRRPQRKLISDDDGGEEEDRVGALPPIAPSRGKKSRRASAAVPSASDKMALPSGSSSCDQVPLLKQPAGEGENEALEEMANEAAFEELSFFDQERGDFVLTNADIHSLEAFFFGTRALVVYLHDLQNAIIDMQHQYDLNKKL